MPNISMSVNPSPPASVAQEYLAAGNFLWNAGIFVWKASTILEALAARGRPVADLEARIVAEAGAINFDADLVGRTMNVDLSGGEKKRNETLQLAVLEPRFVVLDELDSGLDIDALRDCAARVERATRETNLGVLAITHYARLFEELKPDRVHILVDGRIVESGGPELADRLERDGYAAFT
jgi:Fe-S cluster assembly ATP-binding protein